MALLADQSGDVNSNLVTGTGTESVTYTVPGNVPVKVESVVATITNGAAAAITPAVTIRDQSGVVIADKAQRVTIPAGDSGRATFALRLDDDAAPSIVTSNTFVDQMVVLSSHHVGDLLGYWRLGEAASPFDDTSGLTPKPAAVDAGAPPITTDIVGALSPAQDDGAVLFNSVGGVGAQSLHAADPPTTRFNWGASQPDISIVCFVKPTASGAAFSGEVIGNLAAELFAPFKFYGYEIKVTWPARIPTWQRLDHSAAGGGSGLDASVAGAALPSSSWSFLVGTYSAATGHRLYVNGSLIGTDSTVFDTTNPVNQGVFMGGALSGGLDEVSVWKVALTATEIAELYAAAQV